MKPRFTPLRALVLTALALALAACADDDRFPSASLPDTAPTLPGPRPGAPCDEGDSALCIGVYGEHEGFKNCFWGETTCVEGAWSPCKPLPDPA